MTLSVPFLSIGRQAARSYFNLKIERFWIVIGVLFVIGGLWDLFQPQLPLVPILNLAVFNNEWRTLST